MSNNIKKLLINNYKNIINELHKISPDKINNKLQMNDLRYRNFIYSYEGSGLSKESTNLINKLLLDNNYHSDIYNIKIRNKKIYYLHIPKDNLIISPTWRELLIDPNNSNINDFNHQYIFNNLPPFYIGPLEIFKYYNSIFEK